MHLYSIYCPYRFYEQYTIGGPVKVKVAKDKSLVLAVEDILLAKQMCSLDGQEDDVYPERLEKTDGFIDKLKSPVEVFLIKDEDDYNNYLSFRRLSNGHNWIQKFILTVEYNGHSWDIT